MIRGRFGDTNTSFPTLPCNVRMTPQHYHNCNKASAAKSRADGMRCLTKWAKWVLTTDILARNPVWMTPAVTLINETQFSYTNMYNGYHDPFANSPFECHHVKNWSLCKHILNHSLGLLHYNYWQTSYRKNIQTPKIYKAEHFQSAV